MPELTGSPVGRVAVAVPASTTWPASTSAWVITWTVVQVVLAPGASVVATQVGSPGSVSPTAVPVRVTEPVLVTVKV